MKSHMKYLAAAILIAFSATGAYASDTAQTQAAPAIAAIAPMLIIFGAALIAMIYVLPGGVVGGLRKLTDRLLPIRPGDATTPVAAAALEPEAVGAADASDPSPDPPAPHP